MRSEGATAAAGGAKKAARGAGKKRRRLKGEGKQAKQLRREVYGEEGLLFKDGWKPGRLENQGWGQAWDLGDFGYDHSAGEKNSLVVLATPHVDGERYSLNLGEWNAAGDDIYIFLHFNPRFSSRRAEASLVMNSRDLGEGSDSRPRWGRVRRMDLDKRHALFQSDLELVVQFGEEGFNVFYCDAEKRPVHCASFPHRYGRPEPGTPLVAHLPDTDDSGSQEDWVVHEMWWGSLEPLPVDPEIIRTYGAASEPLVVIVSGLPVLSEADTAEVDEWLNALETDFAEAGLAELHVNENGTAVMRFESAFAAWRVSSKKRTVTLRNRQLNLALEDVPS